MKEKKQTHKHSLIGFIVKKWYIVAVFAVIGVAAGFAVSKVLPGSTPNGSMQIFTLYQANKDMARNDVFPFGEFLESDAVKQEISSRVGKEASERIGKGELQANNIIAVDIRDDRHQAEKTLEAIVDVMSQRVSELYSKDTRYIVVGVEEKPAPSTGISRKKAMIALTLFCMIVGVCVVLVMHDMQKRSV